MKKETLAVQTLEETADLLHEENLDSEGMPDFKLFKTMYT